jgi:serine protease
VSLDGENFGTFQISVDRNGLLPGQYTGAAGFEANSGEILPIGIVMDVGEPFPGYASYLYGILLDPVTFANVKQWGGDIGNSGYSISLPENVPGEYFLLVGSDLDNDFVLCDPGEYCQYYPTATEVNLIAVEDQDEIIGTFTIGPPPNFVEPEGPGANALFKESFKAPGSTRAPLPQTVNRR